MLDLEQIIPDRPRRITRAEYDEMVSLGIFGHERLELLDGVIVTTSPNDPPHASPVEAFTEILVTQLAGRARVRVQLPILTAGDSEPEPDVAVVPIADYSERHPDTAHLVVEVASSSLRKDRLVKGPLYAASGFHEYWIVNVEAGSMEVHRGPTADGWSSVTRHGKGETLTLVDFPDVKVRVSDVVR